VELVRLIKEEEPPRPSIRLSTGGGLPKFAAACRAEPGQLPKLVRGELDWIVMKCLDKDRTRRYETVNGLARDVQRYLNDEPVEACPPSASYRLHKFARKHRGLLTTAAAFAGLLLTAAILSTWLAAWAIHAQRRAADSLAKERAARQEAIDAKEKAESFSQRLSAATQFASEGISAYFRGNWAAAQERFSKAEEIEPGLNDIYIYRGMLYTTLGLWDRAAEDYDRRFQLASRANSQTCFEYALLKYVMGDKPGYRQACQEMLKQHGNSRYNNSKLHLVRSLLLSPESVGERANLVRRAEILTADWYHPWTVHYAGVVDLRAGNFERAAARFHEAIKLNTDAPARAMSYAPLAMALFHQGKTAEAEEYLSKAEQGLDVLTKDIAAGPIGSMPIEWYDWLEANLYRREATNLITGAAPAEDPRLITIRERSLAAITYGDAFTFMDAGREHAKRKLWDEAAESFSKVLDQLTPGFRASSAEMWMCLEMVQQPQLFDSLIKLRPNDPRLWHARARIFANRGEWSKAAADCARALELYRDEWSRSGGDWSRLGRMIASLTHHLAALRMLAVDESGLPDLWEIVVSEHDEVNDPVTAQMFSRACTLMTGAVTDWSIPVRLAEPAVAKEPRVAWHLFALGAAQYRAGQTEAAIETLRKSLEVHPTWVGRGQNYVVLALACQHLGRHDEAADWLAQAKTWLDETNRLFAKNQFGYAASDYMSDWLGALVLLREAEKLLAESQSP
jgi:tetratricopeptide (TPR) repeat protein